MKQARSILLFCTLLLCFARVGASEPPPASWPELRASDKPVVSHPADAALVIANEIYFVLEPVEGAKKNAEDWRLWLAMDRGIPLDNIVWRENASLELMQTGLEEAEQALGPGGTLWVIYIGHGAPSLIGAARDSFPAGVRLHEHGFRVETRGCPAPPPLSVKQSLLQELVKLSACGGR